MNVKSFQAETTSEALAKVRRELGPDALILETKRSGRGIEVLAANERPAPQRIRPASMPSIRPTSGAQRLREDLVGMGFSVVLAERIAAAAQCNLDEEQLDDRKESLAYARELMQLWLNIADELPRTGLRVLALVGSSGVGKTTTIAKLAAQELLSQRRTVVLATCDARRVGGAEALAAYARVLDVPFVMVDSQRDLARARQLAGREGTVYLDTPGIPRYDRAAMDRLAELLASIRGDEIELLLPADSEADSLSETLRRFGRLQPAALCATRVDEALRPGTLLTVLTRAGLPLRHITHGPDVPDDLARPSARDLAIWALPFPGEPHHVPGTEA
jgi:flagellar biosynthesis protein FlhF